MRSHDTPTTHTHTHDTHTERGAGSHLSLLAHLSLHVFASLQEHLLQQLHLSAVRGDESYGGRLARRFIDTAITEQREDDVQGDDGFVAVRVWDVCVCGVFGMCVCDGFRSTSSQLVNHITYHINHYI